MWGELNWTELNWTWVAWEEILPWTGLIVLLFIDESQGGGTFAKEVEVWLIRWLVLWLFCWWVGPFSFFLSHCEIRNFSTVLFLQGILHGLWRSQFCRIWYWIRFDWSEEDCWALLEVWALLRPFCLSTFLSSIIGTCINLTLKKPLGQRQTVVKYLNLFKENLKT